MACHREPCPSAVQLTGRQSDPAHLWMVERKKKLTHPLTKAGHSRTCFARLMAFLLYFLTSSPSLFCLFTLLPHCLSLSDYIKENGIQTLKRWFFRGISLPSSPSAGFRNKVLFLASTSQLRFIGLLCGKQSELGLSNSIISFFLWLSNIPLYIYTTTFYPFIC